MYEFLDRLVNIALPRVKDFRGLSSNGFDKFGNYTFGIKEHIIFPEVNFDKVDKIRGLDITIVISSKNRDHSYELLKKLNFPPSSEKLTKQPMTHHCKYNLSFWEYPALTSSALLTFPWPTVTDDD